MRILPKIVLLGAASLLSSVSAPAAEKGQSRWQIDESGAIEWNIDGSIPHYDHIEMSGEKVSAVLRYGVNPDGSFSLERSVVWPMLRTIPNNTHASLTRRFAHDFISPVMVNKLTLNNEKVESMTLDGKLTVKSRYTVGHDRAMLNKDLNLSHDVEVVRVIFPSPALPMLCEEYTITNLGRKDLDITIPAQRLVYTTPADKGTEGAYTLVASTANVDGITTVLAPGSSVTFGASVQGYKSYEKEAHPDIAAELAAREAFVDEMWNSLQFVSPDTLVNTLFSFAKTRAAESIFRTKGGLMHSPGGEAYYAAIWANDQAEYINPFFPFLGYDKGNESAENAFRHFARFMNDDYVAIPSSVIAEGDDSFGVAGDRGDCAMIGYGAARYALASGDRQVAEKLFPLIEWCLEYSRRKTTPEGVVASDSDELENRFPSGDANLCTSTLHYDALLSGAYLADELGKKELARKYRREADALRTAIENYFGANVEGFDTYRYYDGNELLRSWICMPLVTGIFDRADGTIAALLSPKLLTDDGLLSQSGSETFWDRSTLYALRGIFAAGERSKALDFLTHYSGSRLLGEHVPYPIEAWPEGNQRHLSTENALYCRIITEGLFGIRPTGLHSFDITPQLPDEWNKMSLRNVKAFGAGSFDIDVERAGKKVVVSIAKNGKTVAKHKIDNGKSVSIKEI
ncbi:MAG: hypothetical protein HDS65_07420 [Bacteroidales bacterium]|nr:hypothetical protein [Bacteroidales bacterium]